jgi:L,D-transpeptidase ErfK/SrfK
VAAVRNHRSKAGFSPALHARSGRGALHGLAGSLLALACCTAQAGQSFYLRDDAPDLIGELSLATTVYEDTLSDLARAYDQGYNEMRLANPDVDPWIPGEGAEIVVPNLYVLPDAPRDGIVINVPEMRLYFFNDKQRRAQAEVLTFPVSIGRRDWVTPHGKVKIISKVRDPAWYPPESIRAEHAAEGDPLPAVVPAGPDNPLGAHALRLSVPGYLIHGTNKPYGIGMRVTHGCIRMYPKDVARVFDEARIGTPVHIINQPYKVGVAHGQVYLEVHPHLDEDKHVFSDQYSHVVKLILERVKDYDVRLVWADIRRAIESKDGIPRAVGTVKPKPTVIDQSVTRLLQDHTARAADSGMRVVRLRSID